MKLPLASPCVKCNRGKRARARERRRQCGYAYLMALFLVLSIIIGSQVAVQNLLTLGLRDKENDMIWRGNQYVRAIRLYYRKTGHYPQTIDDLEKGLPELHFLRLAAYKDPMNTEDGAWRFIYVNGSGQIIGSVKYASLQQMAYLDLNNGKPSTPLLEGAVPASALGAQPNGSSPSTSTGTTSTSPASPDGSQSSATSPAADTSGASSGSQPPGSGQVVGGNTPSAGNPASPGAPSSTSATGPLGLSGPSGFSGLAANSPIAQQKPTGPVDGPVLGGFLTGVGSKVDRSSVKVYRGAKKYNEFEFIWNPLEDQARAVQQGLSGGATSATPGLGLPGASPIGGAAGAGTGLGGSTGGILGGSQPGTSIGSSPPQTQSQQ